MPLKLLIITIVLITLILLLLGLKLIIKPKEPFTLHTCAHKLGINNKSKICPKCGIKEFEVCPEKD